MTYFKLLESQQASHLKTVMVRAFNFALHFMTLTKRAQIPNLEQ